MSTDNSELVLRDCQIGQWRVPTLNFRDADCPPLCLSIDGYIVNSVTENKAKLQDWKVRIASKVKAARGDGAWNPEDTFAISLGFSFNISSGWHGYRPLDVENFLKPVVDALAAGLFCENRTDPREIEIGHWNYDDSNFNTLLIHRLPDADSRESEGIAVCVSARR